MTDPKLIEEVAMEEVARVILDLAERTDIPFKDEIDAEEANRRAIAVLVHLKAKGLLVQNNV